ncbi:hypothetical protein EFY79_09940 [Hanamia caeni]|jgi:hypothetical protein|uniref:Uncharacterized protein n=1 Tax=Hanamia caeni TaxID=2294116 RepID=A0A3M9NFS7_9BACT|nr:hypothetical protein EFY79_09940 [Hanamia caeni]
MRHYKGCGLFWLNRKERMVIIQGIKANDKIGNFCLVKQTNSVSVMKYSVRGYKDNIRNGSSKFFRKFFSYFFVSAFVNHQGLMQPFIFKLVIILLIVDENHIRWLPRFQFTEIDPDYISKSNPIETL